ncbi:MAG: putative zinc-binding protein [Phycisphaerae bacterium]|jgi:uncharacterized metal-binding protein
MGNGCGGSGCGGETLIFTCAGAAHSGQVANRAGIGLMQEGCGSLFCAAAVGADIPDKMSRARAAGKRVVIDGCEEHCARKILEKAGLAVDVHVDVTELGVEKKPAEPSLINDAKRVVTHMETLLA